jgi:hypothetical protein
MRRLVALAIVLAFCAPLSACGSSSPRPSSPKGVLASIVAGALARKSVHYEYGSLAGYWTSDVDSESGTQRFRPLGGGGKTDTRLVNRVLYFRGDPSALRQSLNLTDEKAKRYAGRWISIPKSDTLYARTTDGLTLASVVHNAIPQGKLRFAGKSWRKHWRRYLVLQGRSCCLYARANGEPLPAFFAIGPDVNAPESTFSNWNEPLNVQAPASSTPIATVRAS